MNFQPLVEAFQQAKATYGGELLILDTETITRMSDRVDIAIVIPAYCERENFVELIPAIHDQFRDVPSLVGVQYSVIPVVERNSVDCDFLNGLGAISIERAPSDSFGDAMRTGIARGCEVARNVIVMDADGSHAPTTIPRLWEARQDTPDADIVIASRYVAGGSTANNFPLRVMSRSLNLAYSLVLSLDVRDISTNFKLYRSELLRDMELESVNFDIVEEILAKAAFSNHTLTIVEIPDHFHARKYGESRRHLGPFVLTYLLTLIRLRIKMSSRRDRGRAGRTSK